MNRGDFQLISNDGSEPDGAPRTKTVQPNSLLVLAPVAVIACGFLLTVGSNLIHDRKLWAVPIAIGIGVLVWLLEKLETRYDLRVGGILGTRCN